MESEDETLDGQIPISAADEELLNDAKLNCCTRFLHRRRIFAKNNPLTAQVQTQALFYMLTFLLTHVWSTTNRILQKVKGTPAFGLVVLHSFFDPLQGFFNFLVYQRPHYLRIRSESPTTSRWRAALLALQFSRNEKQRFNSRNENRRSAMNSIAGTAGHGSRGRISSDGNSALFASNYPLHSVAEGKEDSEALTPKAKKGHIDPLSATETIHDSSGPTSAERGNYNAISNQFVLPFSLESFAESTPRHDHDEEGYDVVVQGDMATLPSGDSGDIVVGVGGDEVVKETKAQPWGEYIPVILRSSMPFPFAYGDDILDSGDGDGDTASPRTSIDSEHYLPETISITMYDNDERLTTKALERLSQL